MLGWTIRSLEPNISVQFFSDHDSTSNVAWVIRHFIILVKDELHTRAIITRSWFETALDYKSRILGQKIEAFPFLVHKLSVILTALQYKPQWKMG